MPLVFIFIKKYIYNDTLYILKMPKCWLVAKVCSWRFVSWMPTFVGLLYVFGIVFSNAANLFFILFFCLFSVSFKPYLFFWTKSKKCHCHFLYLLTFTHTPFCREIKGWTSELKFLSISKWKQTRKRWISWHLLRLLAVSLFFPSSYKYIMFCGL